MQKRPREGKRDVEQEPRERERTVLSRERDRWRDEGSYSNGTVPLTQERDEFREREKGDTFPRFRRRSNERERRGRNSMDQGYDRVMERDIRRMRELDMSERERERARRRDRDSQAQRDYEKDRPISDVNMNESKTFERGNIDRMRVSGWDLGKRERRTERPTEVGDPQTVRYKEVDRDRREQRERGEWAYPPQRPILIKGGVENFSDREERDRRAGPRERHRHTRSEGDTDEESRRGKDDTNQGDVEGDRARRKWKEKERRKEVERQKERDRERDRLEPRGGERYRERMGERYTERYRERDRRDRDREESDQTRHLRYRRDRQRESERIEYNTEHGCTRSTTAEKTTTLSGELEKSKQGNNPSQGDGPPESEPDNKQQTRELKYNLSDKETLGEFRNDQGKEKEFKTDFQKEDMEAQKEKEKDKPERKQRPYRKMWLEPRADREKSKTLQKEDTQKEKAKETYEQKDEDKAGERYAKRDEEQVRERDIHRIDQKYDQRSEDQVRARYAKRYKEEVMERDAKRDDEQINYRDIHRYKETHDQSEEHFRQKDDQRHEEKVMERDEEQVRDKYDQEHIDQVIEKDVQIQEEQTTPKDGEDEALQLLPEDNEQAEDVEFIEDGDENIEPENELRYDAYYQTEAEHLSDRMQACDIIEESGSETCSQSDREDDSEGGSEGRLEKITGDDGFVTVSSGLDEDEADEDLFEDCKEFWDSADREDRCRQSPAGGLKNQGEIEARVTRVGGDHKVTVFCVVGQTLPRSGCQQNPSTDHLEQEQAGEQIIYRMGDEGHRDTEPISAKETERDTHHELSLSEEEILTNVDSDLDSDKYERIPTDPTAQDESVMFTDNTQTSITCTKTVDTETYPENRDRDQCMDKVENTPDKRYSALPHVKWAKNVLSEILGSSEDGTLNKSESSDGVFFEVEGQTISASPASPLYGVVHKHHKHRLDLDQDPKQDDANTDTLVQSEILIHVQDSEEDEELKRLSQDAETDEDVEYNSQASPDLNSLSSEEEDSGKKNEKQKKKTVWQMISSSSLRDLGNEALGRRRKGIRRTVQKPKDEAKDEEAGRDRRTRVFPSGKKCLHQHNTHKLGGSVDQYSH